MGVFRIRLEYGNRNCVPRMILGLVKMYQNVQMARLTSLSFLRKRKLSLQRRLQRRQSADSTRWSGRQKVEPARSVCLFIGV